MLLYALSFVPAESELRVFNYRLQSLNIPHHFLLVSAPHMILIETKLFFFAGTVIKYTRSLSICISQMQLSILCHY